MRLLIKLTAVIVLSCEMQIHLQDLAELSVRFQRSLASSTIEVRPHAQPHAAPAMTLATGID